MRRSNMGLILRHLRDHGGRSRATLAAETGLSKATMTSLISDLVARGLVAEGEPQRAGTVGRPGLTVDLDGRLVCGIGVEISVDYLSLIAVDLCGTVLVEASRPIDAVHLEPAVVIDRVADLVQESLGSLERSGVRTVGVTVAAPGFVEHESGQVRLASNLGWRDLPLTTELVRRLGASAPPVMVENDAKLGGVAEHARVAPAGVDDLLYLSGDVGVGGGIISRGRIMRGADGSAGEIGHMPLGPAERPCACGRHGCWETVVGLAAFLDLAAEEDDPVRDPDRALEDRLRELRRRADEGDERTLAALAAVADSLATGVSILVDVLNPRQVVLGGYFSWFEEELVAPVRRHVASRRLDTSAEHCSVLGSRLGITSAARGGAHFSLDTVFQDPTLVPLAGA